MAMGAGGCPVPAASAEHATVGVQLLLSSVTVGHRVRVQASVMVVPFSSALGLFWLGQSGLTLFTSFILVMSEIRTLCLNVTDQWRQEGAS